MANQEKSCFININGKKYGPYSEQDIRNLFEKKKIPGNVMFYRTGMVSWIPLSKAGIIAPDRFTDSAPQPQHKSMSVQKQRVSSVAPEETDEHEPSSLRKSEPTKKSKAGKLAAVLISMVVVVAVAVVIIVSMGNNTPDENDVMQGTGAVMPSSAQNPTDDADEEIIATLDSGIPDLDKIAISYGKTVSIRIPSSWGYAHWFSYEGGGIDLYGIDIDCLNDGVDMIVSIPWEILLPDEWEILQEEEVVERIVAEYSSWGEFTFSAGEAGYWARHDGQIVFFKYIHITDWYSGVILLYSVSFENETEWYNQNEALIFEIAKTLSYGTQDSSSGSANSKLMLTCDQARSVLQGWLYSNPFELGSDIEPGCSDISLEGEHGGDFHSFSVSITRFGNAEVLVNKDTGELYHNSSPGNDVFQPLDDWYRNHPAR
jgi:hypothetical protein